jgi:hypothetical protein
VGAKVGANEAPPRFFGIYSYSFLKDDGVKGTWI